MSKSWLDFLERLLVILLAGFAFWPNGVSTTSLILLVAIRLFRERSFPRSSLRFILLLTPLFLILLSWVLFGFHPKGLSEIRLLPLMLGCAVYFYSAKTFDLFKQSFIGWSVLQAAFILIFFTTIDLDPNLSLSQQIRDLIGESFNLHPTFLSVAWSWALLIALTNERLKPVSKAVIAIVLVLALALAGGKMPLLALVATGFLLLLAIPTIRLWKKLALGLSIGMVLTALVFSPFIGKRFAELKDIKTQFSEGDLLSSTDLRVGVWRCAIQSIGDHIWTGVGVGNSRQTLETCYSSYHQIEFFDGEYNTHNQWMHFWLRGGVLSILLFILFYIGIIRIAVRKQQIELLAFLVFFGLICLTENYFSRQFGMLFWSLFLFGILSEKRLESLR